MRKNHRRNIAFIKRKIKDLDLDLSGEIVLTELGNNNYIYTPIVAALAGAKVIAWTSENQHFNVEDNVSEFLQILKEFDINNVVVRVNSRSDDDINSATIITNSGFLRPLDKVFLEKCQPGVCVPLMYEAWEVRESDIDINEAKNLNIKVAGTFENHDSINVFDGVGPLAIKLALEAGFEVFNNNILIVSDDHFGEVTKNAFEKFGARNVWITTNEEEMIAKIEQADFVYICNYDEARTYFSEELLPLEIVLDKNPNLGVVHLYGSLDYKRLIQSGIKVYPEKDGHAMKMSETLAYLGPQLVISLNVGGLKVGSLMRQEELTDLVQPITY
jgi:hypothetical protein